MSYLETILLHIFHKYNGERRKMAAFYILVGKKSGQSIHDVALYQLYPYFHLYPHLKKEDYLRWINQLIEQNKLNEDQNGLIQVITPPKPSELEWNGFKWRGFERKFMNRLTLMVQTFSYAKENERSFQPIIEQWETQQFMSRLHRRNSLYDTAHRLQCYNELKHLLNIHKGDPLFPSLFVYRLTGKGRVGYTFTQLANQFKRPPVDLSLMLIEGLHRMLEAITNHPDHYPILYQLTTDFETTALLTESASITQRLIQQGASIEEVMKHRQLKQGTIEDHVVEIAMHDPQFEYSRFVSPQSVQQVHEKVRQLETKRLSLLKKELEALSYFQIKLALALMEEN